MKRGSKIQNWFEVWFDSPYYHTLYRYRDQLEANHFLGNLLRELNLPKQSKILDLACGKGRHAAYLHAQGFNVTGMDLSQNSILEARKMEEPGLRFLVGDMREPILNEQFSVILNLFTSFGYFDSAEDHQKVLQSVHNMLFDDGCFILDYLNIEWIEKSLVPHEKVFREGLEFEIMRTIEGGIIKKHIEVIDRGEKYQFEEQVKAFHLSHFEELFAQNGLRIERIFSDYLLHEFNSEESDRLIMVCKKKGE